MRTTPPRPAAAAPAPVCALEALRAPALAGALPGIRLAERGFDLETRYFACCGGEGQVAVGQATHICDLRHRLGALAILMSRFFRMAGPSGRSFVQEIRAGVPAPVLERLTGLAGRQHDLGMAFQAAGPEHSADKMQTAVRPPSLWAVAAAAIYRYGMSAHVVTLGATRIEDLLPDLSTAPKGRPVLLVERVDRLWNPGVAEALEVVCNFAYHSRIPLFLEFSGPEVPGVQAGGQPVGAAAGRRNSVTRRIAGMRSGQMAASLSPGLAEKIAGVTDGLPVWLRPVKPKGGGARGGRNRGVQLPWSH